MILHWLVLFPLLVALLGYIAHFRHVKMGILITQFIILGLSIALFLQVHQEDMIVTHLGGYAESIGIALFADRLAAVMILLTSFLFAAMLLFNYKKHYMNRLFLFLFLLLQGLLNGVFLARDLFNLYVIIEVSTVAVSILIMFKKDNRSIYDGMIYLISNMISMAVFLLGIGYIYKLFGTEDLLVIARTLPQVADKRDLYLPYSLIITAVGLKAAIMPLFSWLPKAHGTPSAPSIVSAILSGLYVKIGIYLFIRFQDLFNPYIDTNFIFLVLGFLTAAIGFLLAISQTDIKLILAYSTVSQIGLILFSLCLESEMSYWGGIYHIINHAVFKSTLFLSAGIIIEKYGTRQLSEIRGIARTLPFVSFITVIAILGITGAPLFSGSFSKYLIQKGAGSQFNLDYALVFINTGTIIMFIKYSHMLFGNPLGSVHEGYEVTLNQKIALGILGTICFLGGILGPWFIYLLLNVKTSISVEAYLEKGVTYLVSLLLSYLFYRYAYPRIRFFHKIREFELGMNGIALSIVIFFVSLLLLLNLLHV